MNSRPARVSSLLFRRQTEIWNRPIPLVSSRKIESLSSPSWLNRGVLPWPESRWSGDRKVRGSTQAPIPSMHRDASVIRFWVETTTSGSIPAFRHRV